MSRRAPLIVRLSFAIVAATALVVSCSGFHQTCELCECTADEQCGADSICVVTKDDGNICAPSQCARDLECQIADATGATDTHPANCSADASCTDGTLCVAYGGSDASEHTCLVPATECATGSLVDAPDASTGDDVRFCVDASVRCENHRCRGGAFSAQ